MTDIQRQFKHIHKLVLNHLENDTSIVNLKQALISVLPQSYGVVSGRIINDKSKKSKPCDIIVYDKPLSDGAYSEDSTQFQIKHVLLTLFVEKDCSEQTFHQLLSDIASIKQLVHRKQKSKAKKIRPIPERREKVPRSRLPIAMIYCRQIKFEHDDNKVTQSLYVHSLLSNHKLSNRPDYIYMIDNTNLHYRNPLLDTHLTSLASDIGISRLPELRKPRSCYSCKEPFMRRHFFYERFCVRCGDENYVKRVQTCNLNGYTAVVTGARIKIGYAVALRLLRSGAEVIITTRFPKDAAKRYSQEFDFESWQNNLHIYGLDMRDIRAVQDFVNHIKITFSHLDILINNAAQTVRRPPAFYKHLLPLEATPIEQLPEPMQSVITNNSTEIAVSSQQGLMNLSQDKGYLHPTQIPFIDGDEIDGHEIFPLNQVDIDGQQIDNREVNSWTMSLSEVQIPELLEVYLINAITPSILVSQLRDFMKQSPNVNHFVVNVSAVEGQFAQEKQGIHPHTCMAKASLNMLTHSTAPDYQTDNIFVTSVDPGWVSDQVPHSDDAGRKRNQRLIPIDLEDAAARVCDPIFIAVNDGKLISDAFLKDYHHAAW